MGLDISCESSCKAFVMIWHALFSGQKKQTKQNKITDNLTY